MTAITDMFKTARWRWTAAIGFTVGMVGGGLVPLLVQ